MSTAIVQTLLRKRTEVEDEIRLLDELIARAQKNGHGHDGRVMQYVFGKSQPFVGLEKTDALRVYLNVAGKAVKLEQTIRELLAGGADLGQPDRHERTLKIIAKNNPRLFKYNRQNDTIELRKS